MCVLSTISAGLSSTQYRALLLIVMTLTVQGAPTPALNRVVRDQAAVMHETPCYVLSPENPVINISPRETIDDMVRRTEGVKIAASKIIKHVSIRSLNICCNDNL